MAGTCDFDLTLRRSALRSVAVGAAPDGWVQATGSIGQIVEVRALENTVFEVQGTEGELRITLPEGLLEPLALRVADSAVVRPTKSVTQEEVST